MKKLFFIFLLYINVSYSQTETHKSIINIINTNCEGSPTTVGVYKETVVASFTDKNTLKIVKETYEIAKNDLVRKNTYTIKLSDLDIDNLIISSGNGDDAKDKFAMRMYCKNQAQKIKQEYISMSGDSDISFGKFFYMGNFQDKIKLEELKGYLIKVIKNNMLK